MDIPRNSNGQQELDTPEVSFIIVTRNEESAIGRCLESVIAEASGQRAEVLLVDSASTDATVDVACKYPVKVLRLEPGRHLCPSAGRYVGTIASTGRFLAFFDGDMVVAPGWIDAAIASFKDPDVAGVGGWLYRVPPGEDLTRANPVRKRLPGSVQYLGGAAVYRRSSLEQAGGFNPFLRGEEEKELAYRIGLAGGSLFKIDAPMAYHLDKPRSRHEIDEKAAYFTGAGQIVRRYHFHSLSRVVVRPMLPALMLGVFLIAILAIVVSLSTVHRTDVLLVVGSATGLLGLCLFAWKGPAKTTLFLRSLGLRAAHFVRGFIQGLPSPALFQARFDTCCSGVERKSDVIDSGGSP